MKLTKITFEGVKGVGSIQLDLSSEQQVFTFIGVNGIGKTKLLESLFQFFLLTYKENIQFKIPNFVLEDYKHNSPVIFIASQNRGFIKHNSSPTHKIIGNFIEQLNKLLKDDNIALAISPLIRYEILRAIKWENNEDYETLVLALNELEEFEIGKEIAEQAAKVYRFARAKERKIVNKRNFDLLHVATAKCNKLEIRSNDKDIKKLEQLFLDCDL